MDTVEAWREESRRLRDNSLGLAADTQTSTSGINIEINANREEPNNMTTLTSGHTMQQQSLPESLAQGNLVNHRCDEPQASGQKEREADEEYAIGHSPSLRISQPSEEESTRGMITDRCDNMDDANGCFAPKPTSLDGEILFSRKRTHEDAAQESNADQIDLEPEDETRRFEAVNTVRKRLMRSFDDFCASDEQVKQLEMKLAQNASSRRRLARKYDDDDFPILDDLCEQRKTIRTLRSKLITDNGQGHGQYQTEYREARAKLYKLQEEMEADFEKLLAEKNGEQKDIKARLKQEQETQTKIPHASFFLELLGGT